MFPNGLLSASEFVKAAGDRGIEPRPRYPGLRFGQLEALHRAGKLMPLFALDGPPTPARVQEDWRAAREEGSLRPGITYFTWAPYMSSRRDIPNCYSILYSRHQLLALPWVRDRADRFSVRGHAEPGSMWGREAWTYRDFEVRDLPIPEDQLLLTLLAAERRYLPGIVGRFSGRSAHDVDSYHEFCKSFEARSALAWAGIDASYVLRWAIALLVTADHEDPLGSWIEVVRHSPSKWDELRGAALLALDFRIASEVLFRFYEDLLEVGAATEPIPQDGRFAAHRLQIRRGELETTLTSYRLSSQPLVLGVFEGKTERVLVPKVIETLGLPVESGLVQLYYSDGVRKDLEPLAALVLPRFGRVLPGGDHVLTSRRPTKLVIIMDPEGDYETPEDRVGVARQWRQRYAEAARREGNTIAEEEFSSLVEVTTWGTSCFEFAHFSPDQLASAIRRVSKDPGAVPADAQAVLERLKSDGNALSKRLETGWRFTKTALATELWPRLEARIMNATSRDELDAIPIAREILKLYEHAFRLGGYGYFSFKLTSGVLDESSKVPEDPATK